MRISEAASLALHTMALLAAEPDKLLSAAAAAGALGASEAHLAKVLGRLAHVGLVESVGMIFDTLGKKLVKYDEKIDPVLAQKPIKTDFFEVKAGQPCGLN